MRYNRKAGQPLHFHAQCAARHSGCFLRQTTYGWKLAIYVIGEQSAKLRQILGLRFEGVSMIVEESEALVTCAVRWDADIYLQPAWWGYQVRRPRNTLTIPQWPVWLSSLH